MDNDRRRHRSDFRDEALGLYLGALAERVGARAVALGDADGHLIAGAGDRPLLERLAAWSAASHLTADEWGELRPALAIDQACTAEPLGWGGLRCQLAALGGGRIALGEVGADLGRILLS